MFYKKVQATPNEKGQALEKKSVQHILMGRLVHRNQDPRADQKIKIYAERFLKNYLLGEGVTDREGRFLICYPWKEKFSKEETCLKVKIYEEKLIFENSILNKSGENCVFETKLQADLKEESVDVGDVTIDLYEYQNDLPNLQVPEDLEKRPQQWPLSYYIDLLKAGGKEILKAEVISVLEKSLSTEEVQEIFGVSDPSLKLSCESTLDLLLNGLYPCYFLKGKEKGDLIAKINWDDYEIDLRPDLPNVSLFIHQDSDGKLSVQSLQIQYRGEEPQSYLPNETDFPRALYLFNSMALIKGEIVSHLGMAHLFSGQAAMAVFRSMNRNPIKALLFPHLREVLEINRMGASSIFGPDGVLNISGLTVNGIKKNLQDVLAGMCYSSFKPRSPLNEDHRFAKAENLYWEIVTKVVDQFFLEHEKSIVDNWDEVYYLSKNLVENSLPYRPWEGIEDFSVWQDSNEIDNPSLEGRVIVNDHLRAIRPITHNLRCPKEGDMERLKQFCRHSLFMVTFWHWAVHSSQKKWMMHLQFGSLAPENRGQGPFGGTSVENAKRQLVVASTLADFKRGFLVENPNGDIYPPLIKLLLEREKEFQSLNFDIRELMYGTII